MCGKEEKEEARGGGEAARTFELFIFLLLLLINVILFQPYLPVRRPRRSHARPRRGVRSAAPKAAPAFPERAFPANISRPARRKALTCDLFFPYCMEGLSLIRSFCVFSFSLSVSACLPLCLPACLIVCLSVYFSAYLSGSVCLFLSLCLIFVFLSLSLCLTVCFPVCLCLSASLYFLSCLSVSLSPSQSLCLSVFFLCLSFLPFSSSSFYLSKLWYYTRKE